MIGIRNAVAVPFGYVLGLMYMLTGNYLLAIIGLTILVRLCLLPVSIKQQKNSAKQVRLQPKVNKIRTKYAGNQQKIGEETQALYQREGFSPTQGGCMPLLIQMPIMLGLYGVIYTPLTNILRIASGTVESLKEAFTVFAANHTDLALRAQTPEFDILKHLEAFIADKTPEVAQAVAKLTSGDLDLIHGFIDQFRVGSISFLDTPNAKEPSIMWAIPILAAVTSLLSAGFTFIKQRKLNPEMAKNPAMGCMTFMTPAMSVYFTFILPAGVGFYWIVSNIISFIQVVVLSAVYSPQKVIAQQMVEETIQRRAREKNVIKRVQNNGV